jgi:hypothetical protein
LLRSNFAESERCATIGTTSKTTAAPACAQPENFRIILFPHQNLMTMFCRKNTRPAAMRKANVQPIEDRRTELKIGYGEICG